MNARAIFLAHLGFNGLVLVLALAGFYIALRNGGSTAVDIGAAAAVELTAFALVWQYWHGCPFTQLEKRLLAEEGQPAYEGPCLCHYAKRWLGIELSELGADLVSIAVILLPALGAALSPLVAT